MTSKLKLFEKFFKESVVISEDGIRYDEYSVKIDGDGKLSVNKNESDLRYTTETEVVRITVMTDVFFMNIEISGVEDLSKYTSAYGYNFYSSGAEYSVMKNFFMRSDDVYSLMYNLMEFFKGNTRVHIKGKGNLESYYDPVLGVMK